MADQPFPWRKTFILGFGFFGISIIWPLFNSLIPPMLEDLGLAATVIGFIMTWDNIIKMMLGPPGSGKTLLARSRPSTPSVCRAHWHLRWRCKCQCKCDPPPRRWTSPASTPWPAPRSVPGDVPLIRHRSFRTPQHTMSHAGLVGGGQWPRPGETRTCGGAGVSLAHWGVLFQAERSSAGEMPEFGQHGLKVLRQPLADKIVTISRAVSRSGGRLTFPANFMLVGAQTPCPCGYYGDSEHPCTCSPMVNRANRPCSGLISRYQKRLSGPLLDRIDIHVEVPRIPFQKLSSIASTTNAVADHRRPTFGTIRARQAVRFATVKDGQGAGLTTNADTPALALARTIADLAGNERIQPAHLAEAIQCRPRRQE